MFSDVEISVFMDELEEKLQIINDNLLILEQDVNNQEVLQEIFRAAHTIKGSSGIMGYEKMTKLTHEIENLFDKTRSGEITVTSEMINVLFEALDVLKMLKDEITDPSLNVDISDVLSKLSSYLKSDSGESVEKADDQTSLKQDSEQEKKSENIEVDDALAEVISEAELRGFTAYKIKVDLDEGCQMKEVRAFLIFETLQKSGEIVKSVPSAEDLQDGKFDLSFEVVYLTKEDQDQIKNMLMSIAEVENVQVSAISLQESETKREDSDDLKADKERSTDERETKSAKASATPAKEKTSKSAAASSAHAVKPVKTVRVDVQKLDNLMNLVGELVIKRTRLNRFVELFESKYGSDELIESLSEMSNHLGYVAGELQEQIMKARMLPISQIFNRFPRMVRDTAQKLGKEIDFIVEGKETELDRNVIEMIGDPLIHLIRNAIDHGIETPEERVKKGKLRKGKLLLKASYHESHIVIIIEDDGKGIDVQKIREKAVERGLYNRETVERMSDKEVLDLIFRSGFSTKDEVSDLSGRGVGMDVVRTAIEQINGVVEVHSEINVGTRFTIRLPLTLAIIRSLMISLGDQIYAFPMANVQETLRVSEDEIKSIGNSEVIVVRDKIVPLLRLKEHFGIVDNTHEDADLSKELFVVIITSMDKCAAVVVDKLLGEQEVVIKSLGDYLGDIDGLSGATILGDGSVALIIDARGLIKQTKGVESREIEMAGVQYAS
ncbi:chemotaxis protein CheA [Peptococcaceae bacterium]|nr:chemotaxis protein CheA [Peptococcaceae bacterium]